ncbi:Acg family FMN-binding oxidoreductase [Pseudoxanthomonas suwonensis]|uniref:Tat pathway signal protein n=1 Tax=Pseudoxanthomonas suwonensis TaxID=314722 RepID=A0A0E3Z1H5_9GAMM|nr:Tat pathway signal protein [Pseudoxanthomonas suwonensis]AKC87082.1 Tat pathway signal protein [Pseudoxanthomonas suwonensis]
MNFATRSRNVHLVSCATKAASSHNTQPWQFRIEAERITVLPDLSRRCPVVDPDDHHLFASLGCAAENLSLAARANGLEASPGFMEATSGIQVDLAQSSRADDALYAAIDLRQCSRCRYDGTPLVAGERRLLEAAGVGEGVAVVLLDGRGQLERVAEYVAAGNSAQFADPAWRAELREWIRFNSRSARASGDGLYGPVMGSPDVPDWVGRLFMRFAFSAAAQNRKDIEHVRSSSAVAVFVSEADDRRHWVEAGRSYERFALQAAALDLRTAFINQPVEVPELRSQFAAFLGIGPRRPDLVVRVGRGPRTPRSFRRPVEDVILW